jgi:hypothetical protein
MPEAELIPGECDVRAWVSAALEEYATDLRCFERVWARTGEKYFGVPTPAARSLEAELLTVKVARFRDNYDGLPLRLAPIFNERPEAALTGRLN